MKIGGWWVGGGGRKPGWRGGLLLAWSFLTVLLLSSFGSASGSPPGERAATGFSSAVVLGGSSGGKGFGGRPRPSGPCSHLGDAINSISARAYMAGTVFEGKARSRSAAQRPGGVYGVTFVVQKVSKDRSGSAPPLRPRSQVRLQFREKRGPDPPPNPPGLCSQTYNFTRRDAVRANIKRGGRYIVFVTGVGPHNFSLLGEPVFRSRKNLKAVRQGLCHKCFQEASVSGLQNATVKMNERLQLKCRSKGSPLPAISWYKNGKSVKVSSSIRIIYKKKRSSLVIPKVTSGDEGRYECRATSVTGARTSTWATVTVLPVTDNTTTLWPMIAIPCPIETYCLNGGTCAYYEAVGELVCQCTEGYKGQRCENKDVYNRSSMYRPMSYFCKLGISSSYYC